MKTTFTKIFAGIVFFVLPTARTIAQADSLAVVAFYNSTGGPNWTNHANWLTSAQLSDWYGLTVSGGRVTKINLPNNNLVSTGISDSLNLLTAAQFFDFSHNKLTGYISPLLALSPKMQIDLTYNSFDFRIEFLVRHHNVISYPQSVGVPMRYFIHPTNDSITFYPVIYSPTGLIISSQIDRIADGNTTYIDINTNPICKLMKDSITVPYLPGDYYANMVDDACGYAPGTWSLYLNSDTITIGTLLPVTFMQFDGSIAHHTTLLRWQTAVGVGASYFDVQRSTDGRLFGSIGKVAAVSGNTTQNYQYFDEQLSSLGPLPSALYYRLKEVDKNGRLTYSKTLAINTIGYSEARVLIYPNPVADVLFVKLHNVSGPVSFIITSMVGKTILTKQVNSLSGSLVTINTAGLAAGIYFLQIHYKGSNTVEKFVKR